MEVTSSTAVICRSEHRAHTRLDWLDAWHSFNFAGQQRPGNDHFGLLIVFNDDVIQPRRGFASHPHRNLEIITWPVSGRVHHRDSEGHEGELTHGCLQQMTAGSGIVHSEMNPSATEPARWVQMWVVPEEHELAPSYQDVAVADALATGDLVPLVGKRRPESLVDHHQRDAVFWAGDLPGRRVVRLPDAPLVHCYVTAGAVSVETVGQLEAGDALRLTEAYNIAVKAGPTGAELLVWEMHSDLGVR